MNWGEVFGFGLTLIGICLIAVLTALLLVGFGEDK